MTNRALRLNKGPTPDELVERNELANRIEADIKRRQSAPGALGLPPLLDERRLQYAIPDEAFAETCLWDRIYVWQIMPRYQEGKTYGGSDIWMPETAQKRELQESCRGVLVSAGLRALDNLCSNGVELGSVVSFIRFGPWHKPIGAYAGTHLQYLLVLRDGDLIGCEDLSSELGGGKVLVRRELLSDGTAEHRITRDGVTYGRSEAFQDESV
jgi:hypothetical protein